MRTLLLGAAAALTAGSSPATAQVVPCDPPNPPNTCSVSTTANTTTTSETLPGSTVTAPGQPVLSGQLQGALAGPDGAAIQTALASLGVLGPLSAPALINTQTSQENTVTTQLSIGPGTILIGPLQSITFFVAPGTTNLTTNTHTETFVHNIFQASRPLSNKGVNFLTGDLHTGFQTTLLDGSFHFMGALLGRGSDDGATAGPFPPTPMAFAPEAMAAAPFDGDALAYATKAPGVPVTASMGNGWRAWIRGNHGRASFDGTDANFGFANRTTSFEGGIERVAGPWLYGAAAGFGQAKVTQDLTGDRGDIDTFRAGAYAAWRDGPWSLTGAVAAGWSEIDATRLTLLPINASSSYDATTISAGFEAVRRFQAGHVRIEPLAGLMYTSLRVDGFTESGTAFLDLAGDRARIDALKGYVGGRIATTFEASNGWSFTPEVRGRVLYDFLDDPRGYTARFVTDPAATPIPVTGIQPDRTAFMVGGALTARFSDGWRAFASYDAELRGGDVSHLVSGGLKGSW